MPYGSVPIALVDYKETVRTMRQVEADANLPHFCYLFGS